MIAVSVTGCRARKNEHGVTTASTHEYSISDGGNYGGGCVDDGDGEFGVGSVPILMRGAARRPMDITRNHLFVALCGGCGIPVGGVYYCPGCDAHMHAL